MNRKTRITLDFLILLLLCIACYENIPAIFKMFAKSEGFRAFLANPPIFFPRNRGTYELFLNEPFRWALQGLATLFLFAYLFLILLSNFEKISSKALYISKITILYLLMITVIVIPAAAGICQRHFLNPDGAAHELIQTESATAHLVSGKNPYSAAYPEMEDKDKTSLPESGFEENPLAKVYPYPPMTFILPAPLYAFCMKLFGWYDNRFYLALLTAASSVLVLTLKLKREIKLGLFAVILFNPLTSGLVRRGGELLFSSGYLHGTDSVSAIFWILLGLWLHQRKINWLAGIAFAFGCLTQSYLLLALPLLYMLKRRKEEKASERLLPMSVTLAVIAVVYGVFILWDYKSLYRCLIEYPFLKAPFLADGNLDIKTVFLYVNIPSLAGLRIFFWAACAISVAGLYTAFFILRDRFGRFEYAVQAAGLVLFVYFLVGAGPFEVHRAGLLSQLFAIGLALEIDGALGESGRFRARLLSMDSPLLLLFGTMGVILIPPIFFTAGPRPTFLFWAVTLAAIGVYVFLDVLGNIKSRIYAAEKVCLVSLVILITVVMPTFYAIIERHYAEEEFTHDGLIQLDVAVENFYEGKNPYSEGTPQLKEPKYNRMYWKMGYKQNPGVRTFAYGPMNFLVGALLYPLEKELLGWYDHRILQVLFLAITIYVLLKLKIPLEGRMILFPLVILSQTLKEPFIGGYNDSFTLLWIFLAVLLLQKKRFILAGVALALGVMTKHYVVTLLPFLLLCIAWPRDGKINVKHAGTFLVKSSKVFLAFLAVIFVLLVPFFISDAESTWRGMSGPMEERFPMKGYASIGTESILAYLGIVTKAPGSDLNRIARIILAIPFVILLLFRQIRDNTIAAALENAAILTFFVFLFVFGGFYLHWLGTFIQILSAAAILRLYEPDAALAAQP